MSRDRCRMGNIALALALALGVSGCAAAGPVAGTAGDFLSPQSPYVDLDKVPAGRIVHVPTGRTVTFDEMMNVAGDARVVFVGEMHTSMEDHAAELRVLEAMQARHPGQVMLGMEMFQRDAQDDLDRWINGTLDDAAFMRVWYRNWSESFAYYRDILNYAKAHHIRVVALNATDAQMRDVSHNGPPADAGWDMGDPYHEAYLDAVMGGHAHSAGQSARFHAVQVMWDETMAQSIQLALTHPGEGNMRMVALAGGGHVGYGFGIPRRLFRHMPVSYATIYPYVVSLPDTRDDLRMDVETPDLPLPVADFVWSVAYRDLEDSEVRLGVTLVPGGLSVAAITPGSPAQAAGVMVGDTLLSLDDKVLADLVDLKIHLEQVTPGTTGKLEVMRAGHRVMLSLVYRTIGQMSAGPQDGKK